MVFNFLILAWIEGIISCSMPEMIFSKSSFNSRLTLDKSNNPCIAFTLTILLSVLVKGPISKLVPNVFQLG